MAVIIRHEQLSIASLGWRSGTKGVARESGAWPTLAGRRGMGGRTWHISNLFLLNKSFG